MERIRTGIIGCGKVAHLHAQALKDLGKSDFVAVCSRSPERRDAFAERYGVKAYADVSEMIVDAGVQAVSVCTPHPNHAEPTIAAVQSEVHAIVEKPLASSLQDCDAMISAAKQANVKLAMISQRRFYAPVQRIKNAIDTGKLGKPVLATAYLLGWRDQAYYDSDPWRGSWEAEGGGVLVNQAPHQLDILLWFMGEIDELCGYWANLNHPYIEVEDTALAIVRFKNGALGNIVVSNSQNPALYGKVTVFGETGATVSAQTDGGAMFIAGRSKIEEPPINDLWTIPGEEEMFRKWRREDIELFDKIDPMVYYHRLQLEDFLEAILEDRQPMVTGEEGRKTVELFTAIYRSQRDHAVIRFPL